MRALIDAYMFGRLDINSLAYVEADQKSEHFCPVSKKPIGDLCQVEKELLRPAALHYTSCCWNYNLGPHIMKTHTLRVHDFILPLSLSKKSVYLIRDPRDVCVSYASHNEESIDATIQRMNNPNQGLGKAAVTLPLTTWSNHVLVWRKMTDVLLIRYEDLLTDTEGWFAKIVDHYNLPKTGRVSEAVAMTAFEKMKSAEAEQGFKEKWGGGSFFTRGKGGGWKDVLSSKQAAQIEKDHGGVMELYGYE